VERLREEKGKKSETASYYISSLEPEDAEKFNIGIRGHWSIENQLHWVKDVIQNEDKAGIRRSNGIENLSILKNTAINIVRKNIGCSIKNTAIECAANISKLFDIIRI